MPARAGPTVCWVVLLAIFLMVGRPGPVAAQGPVALRVQVIYAANQSGGVDARLGNLAGELQRTFRYTTYQLLEAPQGSAVLNQPWRVALPDSRALEITPTAIQGDQYSLRVQVLAGGAQPLLSTVVRLRRGATVLVGGPKHQQGVLIIAISAG